MALRCFLFSSDEGTSDTIRQVLTGLGVEGESCSEAATAVARLGEELFQIVVIDWDRPEAAMLLSAARDRKPAERPLMLAIVSDDASVPKVLQAGANSILKKPLQANQVTDTLATARDLLRSRHETSQAVQAAAAAASAAGPIPTPDQSPRPSPLVPATEPTSGTQFETDTEVSHFPEQSAAEETDPLKDLEPMAAAVAQEPPPPPPPPSGEPKGLEWYLKARGVARQPASVFASASAPAPAPVKETKPELLGFDQAPSVSSAASPKDSHPHTETAKRPEPPLFSSITENSEPAVDTEPPETAPSRFGLGKKAIAAAVVLAAVAIAAAPQAPWHAAASGLWSRGRRSVHGWLNPQPVTSVSQAPVSHEDFGRAGDEYKLPVAENIPDATTDPSQINVVPVVDPTAKKPAADAATTNPVTPAPDSTPAATPDATQPSPAPAVVSPSVQPPPTVSQPPASVPIPTPAASTPSASSANSPSDTTAAAPTPPVVSAPRPKPAPYVPSTTKVPSSLQSQMAVMTPDASGNKPVEAALPAIEPVAVSELNERALLSEQPPLAYPPNAGGKQGTVTLQVLIGRDGTVQDAKFLQGSLAFARAAIDGVRQWKFKPYLVNGRPVSVATNLTIHFAPGQ